MDHSKELQDTGVVFSDDNPAMIDALPDHADHRNVDLIILKKRSELKDTLKNAIILPPCIFGVGNGPFNRISQQVPAHERAALNAGVVPCMGQGNHLWSFVHNSDLIKGYMILLVSLFLDAVSGDQNIRYRNIYLLSKSATNP